MATLRAGPYSLAQKALLVAKITSRNLIGFAQFSIPNIDGARIQVVPYQMNQPTRGP
jgi:hypothetical protein